MFYIHISPYEPFCFKLQYKQGLHTAQAHNALYTTDTADAIFPLYSELQAGHLITSQDHEK